MRSPSVQPSFIPGDGWVFEKSAIPADTATRPQTAAGILAEISTFRGAMLSGAYAVERALDRLILWHLFRNRRDGTARFFEEHILANGRFGLATKVGVAVKIAEEWHWEEAPTDDLRRAVINAKDYRDRVAHWPVWLQPLTDIHGDHICYRAFISKGGRSVLLDTETRKDWLDVISLAAELCENLSERIHELSKGDD
jgi:hypothetical protein